MNGLYFSPSSRVFIEGLLIPMFFSQMNLRRPSFICPKVDEILSLLKTNLNQRPYSLDRMIFIIVPQMVIEDHKLNPCTKNKHKDNKHMKQVTVEDV